MLAVWLNSICAGLGISFLCLCMAHAASNLWPSGIRACIGCCREGCTRIVLCMLVSWATGAGEARLGQLPHFMLAGSNAWRQMCAVAVFQSTRWA
jgi:hypothetical protein